MKQPSPSQVSGSGSPQAGYTLPVFACAAAIAALRYLQQPQPLTSVQLDLLEPPAVVDIDIEQVATLSAQTALAISRSDPGDNLDLTRHTPIWAQVEWLQHLDPSGAGGQDATQIDICGGEGIGHIQATGTAAIYRYAQRLITTNLQRLLQPGDHIRVTLILPEGRSLAQRTSNAAFGVVDGLSLLGTSGIAQPLSAPGQLEVFRQALQAKAALYECLVLCVGENGLDLAARLGIDPNQTLKTANWLGSLLVEAGVQGVPSVLLFGYHGKLLKLAGGVFHTHHHVADARQEILTAYAVQAGLPLPHLQALLSSATAEAGLTYLRRLDQDTGSTWVAQIYGGIVQAIDRRAQAYIQTHSQRAVRVGTVLFDRARHILATSTIAQTLLESHWKL
jgi:cobalt-precorrin-5B (C1)-methyltransferase